MWHAQISITSYKKTFSFFIHISTFFYPISKRDIPAHLVNIHYQPNSHKHAHRITSGCCMVKTMTDQHAFLNSGCIPVSCQDLCLQTCCSFQSSPQRQHWIQYLIYNIKSKTWTSKNNLSAYITILWKKMLAAH